MDQTVNLTKVDLTQINDNINLIVEENSELKRLNANDVLNSMITVIAVDDGEGNIELKPSLISETLISEILVGEY